jgi:hypothetical protein
MDGGSSPFLLRRFGMLPKSQKSTIDEFVLKMNELGYRVKDIQIRERPTWYRNNEMSVHFTLEMEGSYSIEPETGRRLEE